MIYEINLIKYYAEIAHKLNGMIPVEWDKIVMYAEELGSVNSACFYFYTNNSLDIQYSGNIVEEYKLDRDVFNEWLKELRQSVKELWSEFNDADEKTWYTMTFTLDSNWRYKVRFAYEIDTELGDLEREIIWAYKEMGIMPESEFSKELLENYLRDEERNLYKNIGEQVH